MLDLSGVALSATDIAHLVSELSERNIRVMGLEGVELSQPLPGLPPVLRGGRERDKALLAQPQSRESRNEPDGPELTPRDVMPRPRAA